jgi:hypothetical protein
MRIAQRLLATAGAIVLMGAMGAAGTAGADGAVPGHSASPAASTGSSGATEATVFLASPHPARLRALSRARGLSHAQRVRRLGPLVPSAARHAEVARKLRAEGLKVVHQTVWSITTTGSTSAIENAFGPSPSLPSGTSAAEATPAELLRAEQPFPRMPSGLGALVSSVFPTRSAVHPFHSSATPLTGADLRKAYTSPGTPAYSGRDGGLTVATLQLSGWDPSDLTTYARERGLPRASLRTVRVDGGTTDTSGDVEVALDQESILATEPGLRQQMYQTPNTNAGFIDGYAAAYDDVVGDRYAKAPNQHIAAMSVSWGECESLTGAAEIHAMEPVIQSLVAAGVTVFGAAGDAGIFDCQSLSQPAPLGGLGSLIGGVSVPDVFADVDYPGSSPEVVSVGGTSLSPADGAGAASNDGSNWTETAWSCSDPISCETAAGTGGSGGGISGSGDHQWNVLADRFAGFGEPSWQREYVTDGVFAHQSKRMVPDIAADADPSTGLDIVGGGVEQTVGGTSLATPVSAALLTGMLAHHHLTHGVGDIHAGLYWAYAAGVGVRDITSGTNGSAALAGSDPSVSAGKGYDTVSGIGAVLWPAMARYLIPGLS